MSRATLAALDTAMCDTVSHWNMLNKDVAEMIRCFVRGPPAGVVPASSEATILAENRSNRQFDAIGVAVLWNDEIAIADHFGHRIVVLRGNDLSVARTIGIHGHGKGELDQPCCLTVNGDGHLVVTEWGSNHRVQVLDSAGTFVRSFGTQGVGIGQFERPFGVAVNLYDEYFIAERDNHRLQVFDCGGTPMYTLGSLGSNNGELWHPCGVCVTNDKIIVADSANNRLQVWSDKRAQNDRPVWTPTIIGSRGNGTAQFWQPHGVATDGEGKIIVADTQNNRIQLLGGDGLFRCAFSGAAGAGNLFCPESVAVTAKGHIVVCDHGSLVGATYEHPVRVWTLGEQPAVAV